MKKFTLLFATFFFSLFLAPITSVGGGGSTSVVTLEGIQIGDEEPNSCCGLKPVLIEVNSTITIQTYSLFQIQTGDKYEHVRKPGLPEGYLIPEPVDKNILEVLGYDPASGKLLVKGAAVGVSSIFNRTRQGKLIPSRLASYTVYDPTELTQFEDSAAVIFGKRRRQPGQALEIKLIFHKTVSTGRAAKLVLKVTGPDGKKASREYLHGANTFEVGSLWDIYYELIPEKGEAKTGAYWVDASFVDGNRQIARSRFMTTVGADSFPGNLARPELVSASVYAYARCCTGPEFEAQLGLVGVFPSQNKGKVRVYLDNEFVSEARLRSFIRSYNTNYIQMDFSGLSTPVNEHTVVLFFTDTGISMPLTSWTTLLSDVDPNEVDYSLFGNPGFLGKKADQEEIPEVALRNLYGVLVSKMIELQ